MLTVIPRAASLLSALLPLAIVLAWPKTAHAREDYDAFLGGAPLGVGATFNETGGRAAYTPSFWLGGGVPLSTLAHVGGLVRFQGYIPGGIDLGLAARIAFGPMPYAYLALDVGPSLRTWGGGAYGRVPLDFGLTASVFGLQLAGTAS